MSYKRFLIILFLIIISPPTSSASENNEYLILFRGYHFSSKESDPLDLKEPKNIEAGQEVCSHYASSKAFNKNTKDVMLSAFDQLRKSNPYKSQKGVSYPSPYHWIQEFYVKEYGNFMDQLSNPSSELAKLLKKHKLHLHNNFLVSTSLNILTAVKYALGIPINKEFQNWPKWKPKHNNKSKTLGYLDVFLVPYKDLENLRAFPVVEEFALHNIDIPYHYRKNYTTAEEYTFPLFIPSKYHKQRIPIILEKNIKSPPNTKEKGFFKGFIDRQAKRIDKVVREDVNKLTINEQGHRTFLYLLRHRMDNNHSKLSPCDSVNLNQKIDGLMVKCHEEIELYGTSAHQELKLPESVAIERTFDNFSQDDFSFKCTDSVNLNMHHIASLASHQNLTTVTIGRKKTELEIAIECLGMGVFKYNNFNLKPVIDVGLKRINPITFIMECLVDPDEKSYFQSIMRETQNKIQFKFDSQNAIAQEYERRDYDDWVKDNSCDDFKKALCPTSFSLEEIQRDFVSKLEALINDEDDEYSKGLKALLQGFDIEEILSRDTDIENSYDLINYLKLVQERIRRHIESDIDDKDRYNYDKEISTESSSGDDEIEITANSLRSEASEFARDLREKINLLIQKSENVKSPLKLEKIQKEFVKVVDDSINNDIVDDSEIFKRILQNIKPLSINRSISKSSEFLKFMEKYCAEITDHIKYEINCWENNANNDRSSSVEEDTYETEEDISEIDKESKDFCSDVVSLVRSSIKKCKKIESLSIDSSEDEISELPPFIPLLENRNVILQKRKRLEDSACSSESSELEPKKRVKRIFDEKHLEVPETSNQIFPIGSSRSVQMNPPAVEIKCKVDYDLTPLTSALSQITKGKSPSKQKIDMIQAKSTAATKKKSEPILSRNKEVEASENELMANCVHSNLHIHEVDTLQNYDYGKLCIDVIKDIGELHICSKPINIINNVAQSRYEIDGKEFKLQNVSGSSMRCFFNAVGLDPSIEIRNLKSKQNDPIVRYMIANEIVSAAANPEQLPKQVKNAINYTLYDAQRYCLNGLELIRSDALAAQNSDGNLQDPSRIPEILQSLNKRGEDALNELRKRSLLLGAFNAFLDYHIGREQMMVTLRDVQGDDEENANTNYTSIDAVAYVNNRGIKIYEPNINGGLNLVHQFIPQGATEISYVYHQGAHFQALLPINENSQKNAVINKSTSDTSFSFG